jgi:hypothetical protein
MNDDSLYSQMNANTIRVEANVDTQIVRADSDRIRRWRVGLQRIDRADNFAPLIPGNVGSGTPFAALISDSYSFAAGFQSIAQWPPLRSNPVNFGFDLSVQVNWGYGGAKPAHIAAQWPRMGSSLIIVASTVEVFARVETNTGLAAATRPVVTAWIAPEDGQLVSDAGELSLCQQVFVRSGVGPNAVRLGAVYVPDFARRVRVTGAVLDPVDASQNTTALNGEKDTVGAWIDDGGNVRNSWQQGVFTSATGVEHNTPVEWQAVPAAATMLSLISPGAGGPLFYYVEWRLAP